MFFGSRWSWPGSGSEKKPGSNRLEEEATDQTLEKQLGFDLIESTLLFDIKVKNNWFMIFFTLDFGFGQ